MRAESKVMLVIFVIIGIGVINSLFFQPPPLGPEEMAKQKADEEAIYIANKEHCAKNGLIYITEGSSYGKCMTLIEANAMIKESERDMEKERIRNVSAGLK